VGLYHRRKERSIGDIGVSRWKGRRDDSCLIPESGARWSPTHTLQLENVNYIPTNKYNIFTLGRWDSQGRRYEVLKSKLILYNHLDVPVLKVKIASNIYKFKLMLINTNETNYIFSCQELKQTWETWH